MAGFSDFAQALQFGAGLTQGFQKQTEELKKQHEATQLELLKLLSHDQTKSVEPVDANSIVGDEGFFGGGALKTKEGHPVFRVGGNAFSVKPRPMLGAGDETDLGVPTPTAGAPTGPSLPSAPKTLFGPVPQAPAEPTPAQAPSPAPAGGPGLSTSTGVTNKTAQQSQLEKQTGQRYIPGKENLQAYTVSKAKSLGIPPDAALAMIHNESRWDNTQVGAAGEIGLTQILPSNFKSLGVTAETLKDPKTNIDAGLTLFSSLLKQTGGDVDKALSRYNTGHDITNDPKGTAQRYLNNINRFRPLYTPDVIASLGGGGAAPQQAAARPAPPTATSTPVVTAEGQPADTSMMVAGEGSAPGPKGPQMPPTESVEQRQAAAALRVRKQYANAQTPAELKEFRTKLEEERNRVGVHYNQEVKEVQTELERLLKKTHDPELRDLIESGDIKTYKQFDALKAHIKGTPERDHLGDATDYMKAAVNAGTGDKAAVEVFKNLKKAGHTRDEITDVLNVSGYNDAKKIGLADKISKQQQANEIASGPLKQEALMPGQVRLKKEEAGIITPTDAEKPYVNEQMQSDIELGKVDKDITMSDYLKKFPKVYTKAQETAGTVAANKAADTTEARVTAHNKAEGENVKQAQDELAALEEPGTPLSPEEKYKKQLGILTQHKLKPAQLEPDLAAHLADSVPFKPGDIKSRTSWVTPDYTNPPVGSIAEGKKLGAVQLEPKEKDTFARGNELVSKMTGVEKAMNQLAEIDPRWKELMTGSGPMNRAKLSLYKVLREKSLASGNAVQEGFVRTIENHLADIGINYGIFTTGISGRPSQKMVDIVSKKTPSLDGSLTGWLSGKTDIAPLNPATLLTQMHLMQAFVRRGQDDMLAVRGGITADEKNVREDKHLYEIAHPGRSMSASTTATPPAVAPAKAAPNAAAAPAVAASTTAPAVAASTTAPAQSKAEQGADDFFKGGPK